MIRIVLLLMVFSQLALADARQIDEYRWVDVERVVAIGDIHGDYDNYMAVLKAAGLVDKKGKWAGGKTHLVQTGDIPDRGPDTQKIIEHITKLAKQAKRKGGRVHSLIGNHEAMNMYGDLRYVHPGEYAAFVTRNSESLRDRYYAAYLSSLEGQDPEGFAALPENHREEWNTQFPLGWVEHRMAWDPAWNQDGDLANWVLDKKIAIQVNDSIFLHGGISGFYCQNSLQSITEMAHQNLSHFDPAQPGIIEDEFGPLWYRGLSDVEPHALQDTVDAILAYHDAGRIVVGHTPTQGVIWPRYDAKVIMIDTGISDAYGGHKGYLEITAEGLFAGYPGHKLPVPESDEGRVAYLENVIEQDSENRYLQKRLQGLVQPAPVPASAMRGSTESAANAEAGGEEIGSVEPTPAPIPICGTVQ
jgi:hypothetical protein